MPYRCSCRLQTWQNELAQQCCKDFLQCRSCIESFRSSNSQDCQPGFSCNRKNQSSLTDRKGPQIDQHKTKRVIASKRIDASMINQMLFWITCHTTPKGNSNAICTLHRCQRLKQHGSHNWKHCQHCHHLSRNEFRFTYCIYIKRT